MVIIPSLQGRNHFEVALVPAGVARKVHWGRSGFGGVPAKWGGSDGVPERECRREALGASKVSGECLCWFLQVSAM